MKKTKDIADYLKQRFMVYLPNFSTDLQIPVGESEKVLNELVCEEKLEKVFVPYLYSYEESNDIFFEELASIKMIDSKYIAQDIAQILGDDSTHLDQIKWAQGFRKIQK